MSHRHSGYFVLASVIALALALACGSDDSPTGNGGGGNNSSTLSIPPGVYQASGGFYDCVTQLPTGTTPTDTMVFCSNEVIDEFFGYDCPVKRSGNNLTLSCTRTTEMSTGCFETVVIDIKGTVSGDHYELHGTLNYSDNPADCWNGTYCDSFTVSLDKIGTTPSACSYADAGTIALTVAGGAQAGPHTLNAFGNSDNVGGNIAFYFSGSTGFTAAAAPRGFSPTGITGINLYAETSYIDPANLPQTLQVYVTPPGAAAATAAGGPQISIGYYENNGAQQFSATSAVSGSFVVRELDDNHIAGTLNTTLAGTQYDEQNPGGTPAQRTLTGGYYIVAETPPIAAAPGLFDRIFGGTRSH